MILVISGTNRPGSNTRVVAGLAVDGLRSIGEEAELLDLAELPPEIFDPSSYATKPAAFDRFQRAVLDADGILTVIPEYNGGFPGVMKYFIDMLRFPDSLFEKPAAFIGLSDGAWGALRGVEQLEMIFQYRNAHLYGRRVFIPRVSRALDAGGGLADPTLAKLFDEALAGFAVFCRRLAG